MGKIHISDGIEYEEWADGLVVKGFANAFDRRTKLSIPAFIDKDDAPNLSTPYRRVNRIEEQAFQGESHLECVELPETLVSIGSEAFNSCVNLREVLTFGRRPIRTYYHNTSIHIFRGAFRNCKKLKQVFLNREKCWINIDAFANCTQLETFVGKICEVKKGAFENCNIESLTFDEYSDIHDNSIEKSGARELFFIGGDCYITQKVLNWMKKSQLVIHCEKHSQLADFAYEGINISIMEEP